MDDRIVGVLGGGQLGSMLIEAANRRRIQVDVLDVGMSSAKQISNHAGHIDGSFKDKRKIQELAQQCDILTVEIEHVDTHALEEVQRKTGVDVQPTPQTIRLIQDKYEQKRHLMSHGIAVAESLRIDSEQDLREAARRFGSPFMLKSRKEAYDGRGNLPIRNDAEINSAWQQMHGKQLYAERWANFTKELAVMVVQTKTDTIAYPVVETFHENSICKLVFAPAPVEESIAQAARALATHAVRCFKGKGVYGVEMFLLGDGNLLVNEIAPRPHNSGHYTIEGCPCSQYDAHLRAILDHPIPVESLELRQPTVMLNILGGLTPFADRILASHCDLTPNATLHMYGKGEARPKRKMGHITITAPTIAEATTHLTPLLELDRKLQDGIALAPAEQNTTHHPPSRITSQTAKPIVAVVMGSDSDLPKLAPCMDLLTQFAIPHTVHITSAHRTPTWMAEYATSAAGRGIQCIIAAAGGAAHLPGMAAAHTPLPVIGVPIKSKSTEGMDSLLSIVQMPKGVPVATMAIDGAANAALLAARIVGVHDPRVRAEVTKFQVAAEQEVMQKEERLQQLGTEAYLAQMK